MKIILDANIFVSKVLYFSSYRPLLWQINGRNIYLSSILDVIVCTKP